MRRQVKEEDSRADGAQKDKQFQGFIVCALVDGFKISGNEEKIYVKKEKKMLYEQMDGMLYKIKGGPELFYRQKQEYNKS